MDRYLITLCFMLAIVGDAFAQDWKDYSQEGLSHQMEKAATARLGVLVPMRDGVGLSTDIYTPRTVKGPLPTILWRTPYNERFLTDGYGVYALEAVQRGYVFILQRERGRYFSEGKYEILGKPQTDGYDALTWIAHQSWSNGKVGTLGCSSSAEWQLALAAQHHPAHAAMVPMSAGAGIGKVGRFQEQGNWYTGGVPRSLYAVWLYRFDNPLRAQIPSGLDEATRAHIGQYNDLEAAKPKVDWAKQIKHLPFDTMLSDLGEPPSTFEQFIHRTPADPAWRQGGLYHDDMPWGVPALWFDSWYDVSTAPNLELFNYAQKTAIDKEVAANQYAVIAPTRHCRYDELGPNTIVGERNMGDTTFDVDGTIFAWFDRWLKHEPNTFPTTTPRVRYYVMGENKWKTDSQWPPTGSSPVRLYLRSNGHANSLNGDGRLDPAAPPANEPQDSFRYDPMNPVQSVGGGECCDGGIVAPGALDQRPVEARNDVLVYSSEPLKAPLEVSGFIDAVLKVSSSAKDTDFAVKLVDVDPNGTAWIIGYTIIRARYRDGYDHPALMQPGHIYNVKPTPIVTSIRFGVEHRVRIEVTSSDFPRFDRKLNTGGPNESESTPVVADNALHHAGGDASYIELPVVQGAPERAEGTVH